MQSLARWEEIWWWRVERWVLLCEIQKPLKIVDKTFQSRTFFETINACCWKIHAKYLRDLMSLVDRNRMRTQSIIEHRLLSDDFLFCLLTGEKLVENFSPIPSVGRTCFAYSTFKSTKDSCDFYLEVSLTEQLRSCHAFTFINVRVSG